MQRIAEDEADFNSQPHKEADVMAKSDLVASKFISTHSLTRRLTSRRSPGRGVCCISTHSLTRRLTSRIGASCTEARHFNSQPHKEADACGGDGDPLGGFQLTASQGG